MPIRIRRASTADVPAIALLVGELGHHVSPPSLARRFRALPEGHVVLVAEVGAHVAGFVHVAVDPSLVAEMRAQVVGVGVELAHRGRGVGGRLLDEAASWAREHGAHHLWIRSGPGAGRAHGFYRAHGFVAGDGQRVLQRRIEGAVDELAPRGDVRVVPVVVPTGG